MEKKGKNIFIVILIIIILCLVGYIIFDKLITPKNNETEGKTQEELKVTDSIKVDENKEFVYYEDSDMDIYVTGAMNFGKKIDVSQMKQENLFAINNFTDDQNKVVLNKLVLNIDSADAQKVNNRINELFLKSEDFFGTAPSDENGVRISNEKILSSLLESSLDGLEVSKNGDKYYVFIIDYLSYEIFETDEYISIVIKQYKTVLNGGGYTHAEAYTFSKETGKMYTDEEILGGLSEDTVIKQILAEENGQYDEETYEQIVGEDVDNDYDKNRYFYLTQEGKIGMWYVTLPGSYANGIYNK